MLRKPWWVWRIASEGLQAEFSEDGGIEMTDDPSVLGATVHTVE